MPTLMGLPGILSDRLLAEGERGPCGFESSRLLTCPTDPDQHTEHTAIIILNGVRMLSPDRRTQVAEFLRRCASDIESHPTVFGNHLQETL